MNEFEAFEDRKRQHIALALSNESEAFERSEFEQIHLPHDSLPDLNLSEISIESTQLSKSLKTPFFIAGMTAGHADASAINTRLAEAAQKRGWMMGVGSQRRELTLSYADPSVRQLRKSFPELVLISNLGISQLIELHRDSNFDHLHEILFQMGANALAIHLNPLQECIQSEGTPNFKGGIAALEALSAEISVPLILKETGSGMSAPFIRKISHLKLAALDVSGAGGTHWGRVEGFRAAPGSVSNQMGETFRNWGVSTVQSIRNAHANLPRGQTAIWASGGVRSGLDAAKCLFLGAKAVGFAKPALKTAMESEHALDRWMAGIEQELKVAMFCSNQSKLEGGTWHE